MKNMSTIYIISIVYMLFSIPLYPMRIIHRKMEITGQQLA